MLCLSQSLVTGHEIIQAGKIHVAGMSGQGLRNFAAFPVFFHGVQLFQNRHIVIPGIFGKYNTG
ncbi:hypothetical protein IMSAGC013_03138 [Lachnospiraceae bacterium]|nr:hypothetical protein IMSAGC013_03138 [Lachnospiraceae bacterium]